MMFVSKLNPEQWAEARRMRAEGATYPAIAARFGVTAGHLSDRARREGWPARPGRPRVVNVYRDAAGIRSRLALRLYRVLDCRIRMMELRMLRQLQAHEHDPDGGVPPAPTKDERETFAALIQSIDQVTEIASETAPAAPGRRKSAAGGINPELTALSDDIDPDGLAIASEKDRYRRELAEHLGRMFPKP